MQNVSYALYEERRHCPRTGRLLTHNLEDYRICGIGDAPELEVEFSDTMRLRVARGYIAEVRAKGEPVKEST